MRLKKRGSSDSFAPCSALPLTCPLPGWIALRREQRLACNLDSAQLAALARLLAVAADYELLRLIAPRKQFWSAASCLSEELFCAIRLFSKVSTGGPQPTLPNHPRVCSSSLQTSGQLARLRRSLRAAERYVRSFLLEKLDEPGALYGPRKLQRGNADLSTHCVDGSTQPGRRCRQLSCDAQRPKTMPSQPKTLLSLPEELLACIFETAIEEREGRATLTSAALTCRRLHSAIQPVLYREISILDTDVERLRPQLKCL